MTQREVEVLGLVTAGKIDREIAEEPSISVNTEGNHLRSILSKTDERSSSICHQARTRAGRRNRRRMVITTDVNPENLGNHGLND